MMAQKLPKFYGTVNELCLSVNIRCKSPKIQKQLFTGVVLCSPWYHCNSNSKSKSALGNVRVILEC